MESNDDRTKKRRRSGWDTPVLSTPAALVTVQTPSESLLQPLISFQKTQQILNNQALQKSLSLLNPALLSTTASKMDCRIYVGSIHYDLAQSDVTTLFSCFGKITKIDMSHDPATGKSKGYCFIEFADAESALAATAMDGFELANRKIKVGRPFNGAGSASSNMATQHLSLLALTGLTSSNISVPALGFSPAIQKPTVDPVSDQVHLSSMKPCPQQRSSSILISNLRLELSIDEVKKAFSPFGPVLSVMLSPTIQSSIQVTSTQSAVVAYTSEESAWQAICMMNKLNFAGNTLIVEFYNLPKENVSSKVISSPSVAAYCTLILEDVSTVEDAKEPDFQEEIADEASLYGELNEAVKIEIKDRTNGSKERTEDEQQQFVLVTLRYKKPESAAKAFRAMNNRYFAGKSIKATLAP